MMFKKSYLFVLVIAGFQHNLEASALSCAAAWISLALMGNLCCLHKYDEHKCEPLPGRKLCCLAQAGKWCLDIECACGSACKGLCRGDCSDCKDCFNQATACCAQKEERSNNLPLTRLQPGPQNGGVMR